MKNYIYTALFMAFVIGACGLVLEDDSCLWAFDGVCDDDAYAIAETSACDAGSDYTDCNPGSSICEDTCLWAGDGECDDGGTGSTTDLCTWGTDCTDCGIR